MDAKFLFSFFFFFLSSLCVFFFVCVWMLFVFFADHGGRRPSVVCVCVCVCGLCVKKKKNCTCNNNNNTERWPFLLLRRPIVSYRGRAFFCCFSFLFFFHATQRTHIHINAHVTLVERAHLLTALLQQ